MVHSKGCHGHRIPLPDILKNISKPPFLVQIPYIHFTVPVMLDFNYPLILLPWKYLVVCNCKDWNKAMSMLNF